ncbi:hypothetical protein CU669_16845 [Paramagnetospirillum kuznetsovii]|uniref:Type I restriction endonuclease subunit M n=1 Tax=Paramagnetospirillum kuznetsovii TaxID=2053833 RepID=A0A364NUR1_9PROT|nr:hypothetical protein [Paramagnetospirillum kuznetsovii]RAU20792.1 hypothetical protein CU669_16845 [Paramagnetospirillum kuznetsovii]
MSNVWFPIGRLVATRTIVDSGIEVLPLIGRHVKGDWGDLDDEDKQANQRALIDGGRLFSAYMVNGQKIYIITEADRSSTTVLFAEEY